MQNILAPQIFEKNKYITNLVNLASNFEFGKKKKKFNIKKEKKSKLTKYNKKVRPKGQEGSVESGVREP